jgi:hypothetical protein
MLCLAIAAEAINTGPLEATIHNLGKDIEAKGREGQELQRRWITRQTELVALQVGSWALDTLVPIACSSLLYLCHQPRAADQSTNKHSYS